MPKIIATRSIANVDCSSRWRRTWPKPSRIAATPPASEVSCSGGIGRIARAAPNSAAYVTRSTPYAHEGDVAAISTPATAGPTICTVCHST